VRFSPSDSRRCFRYALEAFQKQLAKLSKDPDASFSGYQQSVEASKKTLDSLANGDVPQPVERVS